MGRSALIEAARALLAERGYPRVTLREIAARAGVRPALVNYYFGGKDGLMHAVTAEVAANVRERMEAAANLAGSPEERLRRVVETLIESLAAEPYAPRLIVEHVLFGDDEVLEQFAEGFARPNVEHILRVIESGQRDGSVRNVEPMFLIPSLIGMCVYFFLADRMFLKVFGVDRLTPELVRGFSDSVFDLVWNGISAQESTTT